MNKIANCLIQENRGFAPHYYSVCLICDSGHIPAAGGLFCLPTISYCAAESILNNNEAFDNLRNSNIDGILRNNYGHF